MMIASRGRAVILPVVLVLIALLGLTMAGFVFFVRAETEGVMAYCEGQQARLAAESGLEEVTVLLREQRDNAAAWYDAPSRFRHALVWAENYEREADPVRESESRRDYLEQRGTPTPAWRFSVVAPRFDGLEYTMRFGLTPESAKLNLNLASDEQIEQLLTPLLVDLQIDNAAELIDAILDWRDEDNEPRENGAESDYYNTLEPGPRYNPKNGPFDTVEELLLVKGVTAAVLYGEDVNRNGILDENEDDGEESFPYYDNADGILNYGIAPFLTVWSREVDASVDNKPRINLHGAGEQVGAQLALYMPEDEDAAWLSPATQAFIVEIAGTDVVDQMRSPADLYVGQEELDPNEAAEFPEQLLNSPVTLEEMPLIMDRFTTRPAESANEAIEEMLININAAPLAVLMIVPSMTEEAAAAIIAGRDEILAGDEEVAAATLQTTAWPLTSEVVDAATFRSIAPYITTRAYQFHVEVLGYADHLKMARRLEWVIEMVGPMAQIKYHRDLTRLGLAWPVDDETVVVAGE